jgi:response regulator RpfG family c-di-GMP phosphodiesterase
MKSHLNSKVLECQTNLFNVETKEHVESVSKMCLHLASFFDFSKSEMYNIKIMSVFHDIGKIKIPIEILEKTKPLTPH